MWLFPTWKCNPIKKLNGIAHGAMRGCYLVPNQDSSGGKSHRNTSHSHYYAFKNIFLLLQTQPQALQNLGVKKQLGWLSMNQADSAASLPCFEFCHSLAAHQSCSSGRPSQDGSNERSSKPSCLCFLVVQQFGDHLAAKWKPPKEKEQG